MSIWSKKQNLHENLFHPVNIISSILIRVFYIFLCIIYVQQIFAFLRSPYTTRKDPQIARSEITICKRSNKQSTDKRQFLFSMTESLVSIYGNPYRLKCHVSNSGKVGTFGIPLFDHLDKPGESWCMTFWRLARVNGQRLARKTKGSAEKYTSGWCIQLLWCGTKSFDVVDT